MPRPTRFWKLSGAGNDFILLEGPVRRARALALRLCARRTGVGADGLLVARRGEVLYLNSDGSRAFCGNGARCAAWWLERHGRGGSSFTLSGTPVRAVVGRSSARIRMPDCSAPRRLRVEAAGRRWSVDYLDTGVPHAVVRLSPAALARLDVAACGRALRRHPAFGRAGANVDFAAGSGRRWSLRTFERGVEAETLACGTGAVAAALTLAPGSPARLEARGGRLTVSFTRRKDGGFTDVWLEGPVEETFAGEVTL